MNIPEQLKYTSDHEWVKLAVDEEIDGMPVAYVGITDFAQHELGDIVFIEIETEGEELQQGAIFGAVEAVKTVSDLFMPLSGKVLEKNTALEDEPEIVNNDPYNNGWMIKIAISDPAQIEGLLDAKGYEAEIGN